MASDAGTEKYQKVYRAVNTANPLTNHASWQAKALKLWNVIKDDPVLYHQMLLDLDGTEL